MNNSELNKVEEKISQLSLLYTIAASTSISVDIKIEDVLKEVLYEAVSLLRTEIGAILLLDEEAQKFKIKTHIGLVGEVEKEQININEGIIGEVVNTGIWKTAIEPTEIPHFLAPYQPKTIIAFPIKPEKKEKVKGIIYLAKFLPYQLPEEDIWLLTIIANRLGVVLTADKLYQELRNTTSKLELLLKINHIIAKESLLELMLPEVLKEIIESLHIESAGVGIYDKKANIICGRFYHPESGLVACNFHLNEGIYGYIIRNKKSLRINEVEKDLKFPHLLPKNFNIFQLCCVPIKVGGHIIGVFSIHNKKDKKAFTKEEENLCNSIANIIGVGLERVEAYQKLVEAEKSTTLVSIASEIAHDIRNPLSIIKAAIFYLKKVLPQEERINKKLQQIDEAVKKINNFMEDMLNFSIPPLLHATRVNINDVINEALEEIVIHTSKDIEINKSLSEQLPNILVDPKRLKQVFINIIKNAVEAMPFGGSLNIRSFHNEENVIIEFEDEGIGIAEEDMPKLFDPFFTTKDKGTGLGLVICKKIIDQHNGSIEIKSKKGEGTTVSIRLSIY